MTRNNKVFLAGFVLVVGLMGYGKLRHPEAPIKFQDGQYRDRKGNPSTAEDFRAFVIWERTLFTAAAGFMIFNFVRIGHRSLRRFLQQRRNPAVSWSPQKSPLPDFDVSKMCFGTLRFGDGFEAAAFLGKPDSLKWTEVDHCEMLYASEGFEINYHADKLAYLAFFIGPDDFLPKHHGLKFSKPPLRGVQPDGIRLSQETNREMLEKLFGSPDSEDADSDETILTYERQSVTMEFELSHKGRLKRWNLHPSEKQWSKTFSLH